MRDHDDRLIRIEEKIDKVIDRVSSCDVTLAAQHVTLKEHMRRTEALEQIVEPIREHVNTVAAFGKIVVWTVGAITLVSSIIEILWYFRK